MTGRGTAVRQLLRGVGKSPTSHFQFGAPPVDRTPSPEPDAPGSRDAPWLVACLCAEWCGTCREFRAGFDALAARVPGAQFRWIDIEDEAALVEDFDVDDFPTVLIQRGATVLFYGSMPPQIGIVERQLAALRGAAGLRPVADVPDLWSRLAGAAARLAR